MTEEKLVIKPKKFRLATSVVSARLPQDMIEALDHISADTGYNRNEVISMCLEFALSRLEMTEGKGKS